MSEKFDKEFEELKEYYKDLSIVALKLTVEKYLHKYDKIIIGDYPFMVVSKSFKRENGYECLILPLDKDDNCILDKQISLVSTFNPEFHE